jgi:hypothetical protein
MAYHHFTSVKDVTRELVACLKPRGTLAVTDILHVEADEGGLPIVTKYKYMVAHTCGFSGKEEGHDVQVFLAAHSSNWLMLLATSTTTHHVWSMNNDSSL